MDIDLIHKTIVVLIIVLDIWLAFWVLSADRKSKTNKQFFLLTILLFLWAIFCYLKNILAPDAALIVVRLAYGVVALFFIPFYFFLNFFPKEKKKSPILDKMVIGVCSVLFFLSFAKGLVIDIEFIGGEAVPILGEARFIYLGFISFLLLFITARFLTKYLRFSQQEKLKAQYLFIGLSIFILVNAIFNIILPLTEGNARYACIGNHSAIFLLGFTAYAIVKRKLFGIKVVLTEILVVTMAMVLLVLSFLIEMLWYKLILFFAFLVFCFTGYLLFQYTRRETKQKEILEQKVQERTKELQKRVSELNRWYNATIGREVKMAELKKEIREKEEEIEALERELREKET